MSWATEKDRILSGLPIEAARCVDWAALEGAYQLASGFGSKIPPAGWERFDWLGGQLPTVPGCDPAAFGLPDLEVSAGPPWLLLAGLALVGLVGLAQAGNGRQRGRRRR
jgi:hypothetical protein